VLVMSGKYSGVHVSDISHCKLVNLSVHIATTSILWRDRPTHVLVKSGLKMFKAEYTECLLLTSVNSSSLEVS
jgi:hypothetical protein